MPYLPFRCNGDSRKYRRRLAVCWSGNYCSDAACSKYARITGTFAALLAFGGICVHLQIFTITGGRLSCAGCCPCGCWLEDWQPDSAGLAVRCSQMPLFHRKSVPFLLRQCSIAVQHPLHRCFWSEQHCSCYRQQQNNGRCVRKDNF